MVSERASEPSSSSEMDEGTSIVKFDENELHAIQKESNIPKVDDLLPKLMEMGENNHMVEDGETDNVVQDQAEEGQEDKDFALGEKSAAPMEMGEQLNEEDDLQMDVNLHKSDEKDGSDSPQQFQQLEEEGPETAEAAESTDRQKANWTFTVPRWHFRDREDTFSSDDEEEVEEEKADIKVLLRRVDRCPVIESSFGQFLKSRNGTTKPETTKTETEEECWFDEERNEVVYGSDIWVRKSKKKRHKHQRKRKTIH